MIRLILASRSPHRLQLLKENGYDVTLAPTDDDEPALEAFPDLTTGLLALAHFKALAASRQGARGLILAADTVGCCAGRPLGKPADRAVARRMLETISGTTHDVLTGWCLLRTRDGLVVGGVERTTIEMRPWSEGELSEYLGSGEWIGKSGAYGLRVPSDPFVTRIDGSAANVIGLPIERLAELLTQFPALADELE